MKLHRIDSLLLVVSLLLPGTAIAQNDLFDDQFEELPVAAQPVLPDAHHAATTSPDEESEIVRERYDNRRVKIEREVVQDENQNYINHGKWKMWDPSGNVLVEGHYKFEEKDGVWTRLYHERTAKLLNIAPFNRAQLPIISQANFKDGKLHGKWVLFDAQKRKLCEWDFAEGRRHGESSWWYVTGVKMREIHYVDGTIHGTLREWDRNGREVANDRYVDGRRLATKDELYDDSSKKAEGTVLYPRLVLDKPDNWEECTLATYTQEGEPVKHGVWTSWYPNGQRKLEGKYDNDVPTGEFVWWHANGQKSLQANYLEGKKVGKWVWWHANGLKAIEGEYADDTPVANWLWWNESGKVAQRADFDDPDQRRVLAMPSSNGAQKIPSTLQVEPGEHSILRSTIVTDPDQARATTRRNPGSTSLRR